MDYIIKPMQTVDEIDGKGYDPMNMFRIDDVVFCSYFVCLSENDEVKTINSAVALKLAEGSNQSIVGYYL